MRSFNTIIIMGNLTADATTKNLRDEITAQNFRLAVNQGDKEDTAFFNVDAYNKEKIAQYLLKGTRVLVKGRLAQRKYQKDGQDVTIAYIIADDITLISTKDKDADAKPPETFEEGHHD